MSYVALAATVAPPELSTSYTRANPRNATIPKLEGLKVKALTKDVALVSYQATIKGTYKGKEVPSPVQVVEVWMNRDGKWLQASYQETPVDQK